eukprot:scaffold5381_cov133-Cylindrotheca_fusiformis.AAC.2
MEVEDEAGVEEEGVEAEAEEDIEMVLLPLQRPVLREPPRRWMERFFKPMKKEAVPISLTTPKKNWKSTRRSTSRARKERTKSGLWFGISRTPNERNLTLKTQRSLWMRTDLKTRQKPTLLINEGTNKGVWPFME